MEQIYTDKIKKKISKLIIGTGTNRAENENFILWDHWLKNEVNIFDTSYHYNDGEQETVLGKWIEKRELQDKVAIISIVDKLPPK